MPEIQLTPKERQALKAQAHGLKPVVLLGSAGLSPSVVKEIDRALLAHELIKVKVPGDDRAERDEIFTSVAESLSAARVQAIGKLLVLYRPAPDEEEDPAPTRTGSRKMTTADRSPKAPDPWTGGAPYAGHDPRPDQGRPHRSATRQPRHRTPPRPGHGAPRCGPDQCAKGRARQVTGRAGASGPPIRRRPRRSNTSACRPAPVPRRCRLRSCRSAPARSGLRSRSGPP